MKNIDVCLWFDSKAEEATQFYKTVFKNVNIGNTARYGKSGAEVSGQKEGAVMTVEFQLEDLKLLALNGGPIFKFTPAISLSVACSTEQEIQEKWKKISDGGKVRMGLDKYPWSDKYGWTADKYGVEWQLILAPRPYKVVPSLLFVDKLFGKGDEALQFYTSVFPNSKIETVTYYEGTKNVMYSMFNINGQGFTLMDGQGTHGYTFNEATSLVINCEGQNEIDQYWQQLTAGGSEQPCGWLKDKFGVSWQVVPAELSKYMNNPDTAEKAMKEILKMKKINLSQIKEAIK